MLTTSKTIRERVLAAWAASPARFREDANAEEDVATGSPLVELAQNAADAASRAGVPGRLHVEVVDGVLYAANTGAPLDDAGIEALCHLRASTKDAASVGRYGIGFKAVLALTDSPAIYGRDRGVRWSREETAREVAAVPSLADEVARRRGAVPVMRLPYDATPDAHAAALLGEWDTVVALPLRDPARADAALGEVDETLLLTLPLDSLVVSGRAFARDPSWVVRTATGTLPPDLLAGRPVEERERSGWTVAVALPAPEDRLLRAPQPTGERVDVPVFVSASVPLEPSRKHVVPGPLMEWLAARTAETFVALLESVPKTPDVLDLVPATLPAGPFDLALREALLPLLPAARVFPEGRRAVLDLGPTTAAVTEALGMPQLLDPSWLRRRSALDALGVRVLETADVVELLHGVEQPPSWWASVYAALANVPDRDALRALPVPLADGRVVTGPRGLLIGEPVAGLRFVHPDARTGRAAEVLRGAGAEEADPGAILDALRAAVEASLDDDGPLDDEADPAALADTVLRLLRSSPTAAEGRAWLGNLALPSEDGDLRAADELLLPGAPITRWLREDTPFGIAAASLLEYGDALAAVGVVSRLAPRDFEEIRPDAWAEALADLDSLDEDALEWLRTNVLLPATDGTLHPPHDLLAADADLILDGLYPRAAPLPPVAARLGLVTSVADMDEDALADLADRIAERATVEQAHVLYAALARRDVPLDPSHVRALRDGALVTVPADEVYAVDHPGVLPLKGVPWLPVDVTLGARLAGVLGVRLASESFAPQPMDRARDEAWRAGDWLSRHRRAAELRGEPTDEFWLDT